MLIKAGLLKAIGGITAGVVVPTAVIGGFFLVGQADKYRGFYTNPLNDGGAAMVNAYRGAVQQGAETILTPGFNHAEPIATAFDQAENFFAKTGFLLLDGNVAPNKRAAPNTMSVTYRTDLGSIQAGVAAAYFLNFYQDVFLDNGTGDDSLTYAMWGGQGYASVTSFMGGFAHGIEWANVNLAGQTINGNMYKKVWRLGDNNSKTYKDMTGGFGPSDGDGIMASIIADRPDLLMPVAGPQVWTARDKIASINSKTLLIGVDSAVEDDTRNPDIDFKDKNGNKIGNGKRVQFSSLKNLARSVESAFNIINNGNIVPEIDPEDPDRYKNFSDNGAVGEAAGYGTIAVGDSENGCVGVSGDGVGYFDEAIRIVGFEPDLTLTGEYNEPSKMVYQGYEAPYDYAHTGMFGLVEKFKTNNSTYIPNLNKRDFVEYGDANVKTKFKIILSSANSILMDASFSQSCYVGLYTYLKSQGIDIPPATGGKE